MEKAYILPDNLGCRRGGRNTCIQQSGDSFGDEIPNADGICFYRVGHRINSDGVQTRNYYRWREEENNAVKYSLVFCRTGCYDNNAHILETEYTK